MCGQGRPEVTEFGIRFFEGVSADAYLQRAASLPGYSIIVWRGRHVPDVSELEPEEATRYWLEVLEAARLLTAFFEPAHLNYQLLGNKVPHVHTHLQPRYLDDPAPEAPLRWDATPVPEPQLLEQVRRLRDVWG